jgi:hypothetical protein
MIYDFPLSSHLRRIAIAIAPHCLRESILAALPVAIATLHFS